jgi:hypothetical protein
MQVNGKTVEGMALVLKLEVDGFMPVNGKMANEVDMESVKSLMQIQIP